MGLGPIDVQQVLAKMYQAEKVADVMDKNAENRLAYASAEFVEERSEADVKTVNQMEEPEAENEEHRRKEKRERLLAERKKKQEEKKKKKRAAPLGTGLNVDLEA